jgi:F-type H+-transporting ATPase subunit delta
MSDPRLGDEQRVQAFTSLLKSDLPQTARNFIALLVQNDRLLLAPEITLQFEALKNRQEGTAQADITSAFPMSDDQVKDLLAVLELKFGLKLKPHVTVDSSLIGGVRVAVGDQVLDTSVQAQLARMRVTLAA